MDYYRLGYVCPYFKKTHADRIRCERGCCIVFTSHTEAKKYLHAYCASSHGWEECTIAKMLTEYWEEQDV